jgi:hypothetical protein
MMTRLRSRQLGSGAIGLVITLIIIGYVAYVGIQYVPQIIEEKTVQAILDKIQQDSKAGNIQSAEDIERVWAKHLNINEMNELKNAIEIDGYGGRFTIVVQYERELDLLFDKKTIQ